MNAVKNINFSRVLRASFALFVLVGVSALASCIKADAALDAMSARGSLVLSPVSVVEDARDKNHNHVTTRAEGDEEEPISTDDFIATITDALTGEGSYKGHLADFPSELVLSGGEYLLTVQSHEAPATSWDDVHYSLSRNFSIIEGETTVLEDLACQVSSILVSVRFTDNMKQMMGDDCEVAVEIGNFDPLVFEGGEQGEDARTGCFVAEVEENMLVWDFSGTVYGKHIEKSHFIKGVRAGEHRTLTFDVTERGSIGDIGFDVSVEVETYDINLNVALDGEDVIIPFIPPVIIEATHGLDQERSVVLYKDALDEGGAPRIDFGANLSAEKSIGSLAIEFTTDNASLAAELASRSLAGEIDLVAPDAAVQNTLAELGLPVGEDVTGKTDLALDLSALLPLVFEFGTTQEFDIRISAADSDGASGEGGNVIMRLKFVDNQFTVLTIEGDGFDITQTMTILKSQMNDARVKVDITASAGIEHFFVEISSTSPQFNSALEELMLDKEFDLVNPGILETILRDPLIGLPCGDDVLGKGVEEPLAFDISRFVPMLFLYVSDGGLGADFRLTVVDADGVSETQTVKLWLTNN